MPSQLRPSGLGQKPLPPAVLLSHTTHRLWQPPRQCPWVMAQSWGDLLFAHWPVKPEVLRPLVPGSLPLDTYDGQAWVGIVPFAMGYIRARGLPPIPGTAFFLELNVRTYVMVDGKPGVWFFSLDANNPLAVFGARRFFRMPYFNAVMTLENRGDTVVYASQRPHHGAQPAEMAIRYRPTGPVYFAQPGTLEHWLTERYCLYTTDRRGSIYRGDIHHRPWPLQPAEAEISRNTMADAAFIPLPDIPPLLYYARRMDMVTWYLATV